MAENTPNRKERKEQERFWIRPSVMARVEAMKSADNCESNSEFAEKALEFYLGYLECKENRFFLPKAITSAMKGIVAESINQQNTILFKMAVELNILMNIVADANPDIDELMLQRLRGYCVDQVKKSNGLITFDDVVKSLK